MHNSYVCLHSHVTLALFLHVTLLMLLPQLLQLQMLLPLLLQLLMLKYVKIVITLEMAT